MLVQNLEHITDVKEFRTAGKFLTTKPNELGTQLFTGVILGCIDPPVDGDWELWECEVVITPRRKSKLKPEYQSYRYDQIISSGLLNTSANATEKPYYEIN